MLRHLGRVFSHQSAITIKERTSRIKAVRWASFSFNLVVWVRVLALSRRWIVWFSISNHVFLLSQKLHHRPLIRRILGGKFVNRRPRHRRSRLAGSKL